MNKEFIDKWQSQVKKGTLSFVVLLVLKENELYGYELIEKILTLYHQKTECFSPSSISKTREVLCFYKISLPKHQ